MQDRTIGWQQNWSPGLRLGLVAGGTGLLAYGFTLRFPSACVVGTVGLGLLACGLTNRSLKELIPDRVFGRSARASGPGSRIHPRSDGATHPHSHPEEPAIAAMGIRGE